MDINLELINRTQKELDDYIQKIKNSNLDNMLQGELIDVLETVGRQIEQAEAMGWL